jgi:hypothetical protein
MKNKGAAVIKQSCLGKAVALPRQFLRLCHQSVVDDAGAQTKAKAQFDAREFLASVFGVFLYQLLNHLIFSVHKTVFLMMYKR